MNIRKKALALLLEWEQRRTYLNLSVPGAAKELPERDKTLLTALVYGTVERLLTLDYFIGAFGERSPRDLDPYTRCLLRMGLYQVLYFTGMPVFASVHETVSLARNRAERGFVNAVLRRADRERQSLPYPPREKNVARHLSVYYSVPLWIVKQFLADYGDEGEALLASSVRRAPLTLSVNTCRCTRDDMILRLAEGGIYAVPTKYASRGITVGEGVNPTELPGFEEGLFWVQDEASQIATAALDARRGNRVIDMCACPGGKSFGAAVSMADEGEVRAYDLHESKLPLIRSGAGRLGLRSITAQMHDGTVREDSLLGWADRVIADVPCSGLGVLSKKPDLRYRDEAGAAELPQLQYRILENAASYLKEGGVLLYSTCTLNRAENQEVAMRFLSEHPEYTPSDFSVGELSSVGGMLTLLPHRHATDGFFLFRIARREK